jgi:hypothetical protein
MDMLKLTAGIYKIWSSLLVYWGAFYSQKLHIKVKTVPWRYRLYDPSKRSSRFYEYVVASLDAVFLTGTEVGTSITTFPFLSLCKSTFYVLWSCYNLWFGLVFIMVLSYIFCTTNLMCFWTTYPLPIGLAVAAYAFLTLWNCSDGAHKPWLVPGQCWCYWWLYLAGSAGAVLDLHDNLQVCVRQLQANFSTACYEFRHLSKIALLNFITRYVISHLLKRRSQQFLRSIYLNWLS